MAHYSTKRPVFKSKAEMYKKSKWIKLKEALALFFSNVRRFFNKITHRINEKGSQRLTIMLVPHSEKRIFNVQISNYILLFSIIIIAVTITTAVIAISNNQQTYKQVQRLSSQNESKKELIEEYRKSIDNLNSRFTLFKEDVKTIMETAGRDENIYDFENIELSGGATNENIPEETEELERLGMELEVINENLWRMGVFIAENERLLKEIPSLYPLASRARISSPFGPRIDPINRTTGEFHKGIDLATFPGTRIFATADGEVVFAGWGGGYGLVVKIKHKYGFATRYAHMRGFAPGLAVGSTVKQGQVIGYVGTTGRSTGYHVHYEVFIGNERVDPQPFMSMLP